MMRKNVTTRETIDFGRIPKDCLSLLEGKYVGYYEKPTSTLTKVQFTEDFEDKECASLGTDGANDSSDSSSDSDSEDSHVSKNSEITKPTQSSNQQNVINDKNIADNAANTVTRNIDDVKTVQSATSLKINTNLIDNDAKKSQKDEIIAKVPPKNNTDQDDTELLITKISDDPSNTIAIETKDRDENTDKDQDQLEVISDIHKTDQESARLSISNITVQPSNTKTKEKENRDEKSDKYKLQTGDKAKSKTIVIQKKKKGKQLNLNRTISDSAKSPDIDKEDTGKKRKLHNDELIVKDTKKVTKLRKQRRYSTPNPMNSDQDEDNNSKSSDAEKNKTGSQLRKHRKNPIPELMNIDKDDDSVGVKVRLGYQSKNNKEDVLNTNDDAEKDTDNLDLNNDDDDAKSDIGANEDNAENRNNEETDIQDSSTDDDDAKSAYAVNEDNAENENDEDTDNPDSKNDGDDVKSDNDVNEDNAQNENNEKTNIDNDDEKSENDANEVNAENENDETTNYNDNDTQSDIDVRENNDETKSNDIVKYVKFLEKEDDKLPEEYLEDLKDSYLEGLNNEKEKISHVFFPMECLIDKNIDRPELVKLSRKHISHKDQEYDTDRTHAFHMQYVPFTKHFVAVSRLISSLLRRFNKSEEKVMKSVLNDESTQALSLGFCDNNLETHEQDFSIISTIIFRIVCGYHVKDQFIFIYYRATDDRPLSDRQSDKDGFFTEYKKKMDNHGFGRFLIMLSQQLLKKFSNDKEQQKIYLLAKPDIARDYYIKGLGFQQLGYIDSADSNQLYKDASKELKECLDVEKAEDTTLVLLVRTQSISSDKVSFARKMTNTLANTIHTFNKKKFSHHEPLIMSLMKKDYSRRLERITDQEVQLYIERQSSNTNDSNPFEFMLPDIHEYSRLQIKDVIEQLDMKYDTGQVLNDDKSTENLFDDEVDDETETEEDEDETPRKEENADEQNNDTIELSSVDRQFMSMFDLEVEFDGKIDKKEGIKCKYGNIYCNECKKQIFKNNIPVKTLIKWGTNIMQKHLIGNTTYLGFVTSKSKAKFEESLDLDKRLIVKCSGSKDRKLISKLFGSISTDSRMNIKDAKYKAKCAIVFIDYLITHFYDDESSLYKHYIQRGLRVFDFAMEEIRKDAVRENRKKRKDKDKELEGFLGLYRNLYYDRGTGLTFAQREKITLEAITKNPPKKPVPEKKNRPIMFHGVDLSIFPTVKERQKVRNKMREEEVKTNWHSIERVNKLTREKDNKLLKISQADKRDEHWLGHSTVFGKEESFLVTYTMIPEKWENEKGQLFGINFLKEIPDNTPKAIGEEIRNTFKTEYKKLKIANVTKIKLHIDPQTKNKSWEAQTADKRSHKNLVDENYLDEEYKEDEPVYYDKLHNVPNVWHDLPDGAKKDTPHLPKIEEEENIAIYKPDEKKCAFANMANALYAIGDNEVADFFVSHMNSDYQTLTSLIDDNGGKGTISQFMIAVRILQHKFYYKIKRLKENDDLLTPPKKGFFKYATVIGAYDDYKHVISIVQNQIFDSSNKKVLTLCSENIAWCCSKTLEDWKNTGKTIYNGYLVYPLKKKLHLKKRKFTAIESDNMFLKNLSKK